MAPKVLEHLDYLTVTYQSMMDVSYPPTWSNRCVEVRPHNGYTLAVKYDDGRLEMSNSERRDMGVHIILSGSVLAGIEENDRDLVAFFLENGASVRRMDIAIDAFDSGLSVADVWRMAQNREFKCRLRKPPSHDESAWDTGDTVYFGRFASSVYTRIYDKTAEQKIIHHIENPPENWLRIETGFRDRRGQSAARMVAAGVPYRAMVRGHVDFPSSPAYAEIMTAAAIKTRFEPPVEDNTMKWLLKSCAPTLAREWALHGDDVWNKFRSEVFEQKERIENEKQDASRNTVSKDVFADEE